MWLLQVLLLLPKVLLCHLLRALPAPTGCTDHGMGPGDPTGTWLLARAPREAALAPGRAGSWHWLDSDIAFHPRTLQPDVLVMGTCQVGRGAREP